MLKLFKKVTNIKKDIKRLISVEPTPVIFNMSLTNYAFPKYVEFISIDLYDLQIDNK